MTIKETIAELIRVFEERNDEHAKAGDTLSQCGHDWEIEQLLKVIQILL